MVVAKCFEASIFAKTLLIPSKWAAEDRTEYEALLSHVVRHFKPSGFQEEFWTERVAVEVWRQRRLRRYESGISASIITEYIDELQHANADSTGGSTLPLATAVPVCVDHVLVPEESDRTD